MSCVGEDNWAHGLGVESNCELLLVKGGGGVVARQFMTNKAVGRDHL